MIPAIPQNSIHTPTNSGKEESIEAPSCHDEINRTAQNQKGWKLTTKVVEFTRSYTFGNKLNFRWISPNRSINQTENKDLEKTEVVFADLSPETIQSAFILKVQPVFLDFPHEIIQSIFSLLDVKSLGQVAKVCRIFNIISKSDAIWRPKCDALGYKIENLNKHYSPSYKNLYRNSDAIIIGIVNLGGFYISYPYPSASWHLPHLYYYPENRQDEKIKEKIKAFAQRKIQLFRPDKIISIDSVNKTLASEGCSYQVNLFAPRLMPGFSQEKWVYWYKVSSQKELDQQLRPNSI